MTDLIALKALIPTPTGLRSPVSFKLWEAETVGGSPAPVLRVDRSHFDHGLGVVGMSYSAAREYGDDIYTVSPVPGARVAPDNYGWRAEAAYVVGGPYRSPAEAAQAIISAALNGDDVAPGVLMDATLHAPADVLVSHARELASLAGYAIQRCGMDTVCHAAVVRLCAFVGPVTVFSEMIEAYPLSAALAFCDVLKQAPEMVEDTASAIWAQPHPSRQRLDKFEEALTERAKQGNKVARLALSRRLPSQLHMDEPRARP